MMHLKRVDDGKHFLLFVFITLTSPAYAQDQSGFISLDCGIDRNTSYTDVVTGINYVSDAAYTDSGETRSILSTYQTDTLEQQFVYLRSFPQGVKNCYTLTPPKVVGRTRYFVRARFMYGNYDSKSQIPKFDLYLGVDFWVTVQMFDASVPVDFEMLYSPSSNYTYVCLVNTGHGTPFISALELRLVDDEIYKSASGSLALIGRFDLRSVYDTSIIRFKDDVYDRIWGPSIFPEYQVSDLNTSSRDIVQNSFKIPSVVMATAVAPKNPSMPLVYVWAPPDPTIGYYYFMHFADFQSNQTREFNITLNGGDWFSSFKPSYLTTTTLCSTEPETPTASVHFSFFKTNANSILPPIINAVEVYVPQDLLTPQTDQGDVDAIKDIKAAYGLTKNWQGDPCTPNAFTWEGLTCLNVSFQPPRIIALNLSFSRLTGSISNSIYNLKMLQYLDLSHNSLSGEIPSFLSQMQDLTVIKLSGNDFTGTVPAALLEKQKNGSLSLSIEGNPNLCSTQPCKKPKKNSIVAPIMASLAVVFALSLVFAIWWKFYCNRRTRNQPTPQSIMKGSLLTEKQKKFTYSEILTITKNFERKLGKGGFGTVYHGYVEDSQVAVKMLSPSSAQGYKEFKAEAEILMKVYHKNLTTLVGYCDEGDKLGLVYEFMANGDLETHLSDKDLKVLTWELRLEIALDAALGLEYLHTGCKPPIIHRDVKTTNILLSDEYYAKLADFGLSRAFPSDSQTHLSTDFAGTFGYFDPALNLNEKSDVYSFGVVLLEIVTGRRPIARTEETTHITQWVSDMLKAKGDVREVVDPRLGNDFDINSVWKVVDVAMECVKNNSTARPTMNNVVSELKICVAMENDRMKKGSHSEAGTDYVPLETSTPNITTVTSPVPR